MHSGPLFITVQSEDVVSYTVDITGRCKNDRLFVIRQLDITSSLKREKRVTRNATACNRVLAVRDKDKMTLHFHGILIIRNIICHHFDRLIRAIMINIMISVYPIAAGKQQRST